MALDLTQAPVTAGRRIEPARWAPLTGFAFVACFAGSVAVSSPPADTAANSAWIANYTGSANQVHHLATGVLLVLAGISLVAFLGQLWSRIASARPGTTPIPMLLAAMSGACIAVGGVLMAGLSGALLTAGGPVPDADLLRAGNDLGFGMVSVGGMLPAAFAVASLSVLARRAGVFGRPLLVLGIVAAVLLLGAVAFLPILGLLAWVVVAATALLRSQGADARGVGERPASA